MTDYSETRGVVLTGASVLLLGRVARADGQLVTAAETASLTYRIEAKNPYRDGEGQVVSGHDNATLQPSAMLYDSLQTAAPWEVDSTGYNFRHEVDVTTDVAFPEAGRFYEVRYELTPLQGQPIIFRFLIEAI